MNSQTVSEPYRPSLAYSVIQSPLEDLLVIATAEAVVRIAYTSRTSTDELLTSFSKSDTPVALAQHPSGALATAIDQLGQYFDGSRAAFDLPMELGVLRGGFTARVLLQASAIPYGTTTNYGAIAARCANPRGARAAGNALGSNPLPIVIPCHRIIRSDGSLGGYTGGLDKKAWLLELEQRTQL